MKQGRGRSQQSSVPSQHTRLHRRLPAIARGGEPRPSESDRLRINTNAGALLIPCTTFPALDARTGCRSGVLRSSVPRGPSTRAGGATVTGRRPAPGSEVAPLLEVHRPSLDEIDWPALDAFGDRLFAQRRQWLEFVAAFTGGEVVVAQLHRRGEVLGYFSGIRFRRCGIPILGSPFRGWTTPYMGFNLAPGVSRIEALVAVERFAFRQL